MRRLTRHGLQPHFRHRTASSWSSRDDKTNGIEESRQGRHPSVRTPRLIHPVTSRQGLEGTADPGGQVTLARVLMKNPRIWLGILVSVMTTALLFYIANPWEVVDALRRADPIF